MLRHTINPGTVFDSTRYGFSQAVAVQASTWIHVSGQVGISREEAVVGSTLAEQTPRAFDNLRLVLEAAGGGLADVVSLRLYVVASAADDLSPIRAALQAHFPEEPPAATWLVVSGLANPAFLVEIEAVAAIAGRSEP